MASDYLLEIDGIPGESQGKIQLVEFDWGLTNRPPSGEGGSGRASPKEFTFTAYESIVSPKLFFDCATRKRHASAIFTASRVEQDGRRNEFLKITLSEVFISSYDTSSDSDNTLPIDTVTLRFEKIQYTFTPRPPGAPVTHSFDFRTGTGT